ncbi:MAG: hypothetical protein ACLR23_05755 [Clostridia bacterium]
MTDFQNVKKILDLAAMRLPMKDGEVDYEEFSRMIDTFLGRRLQLF